MTVLIATVVALGGGLAWFANQEKNQAAQEQVQAEQAETPAATDETSGGSEQPEETQTAAANATAPAEPAQDTSVDTPAQETEPVETAAPESESQDSAAEDSATQDAAPVAEQPAPEAEPALQPDPEFDIVRVDENGNVVIAGRAAPGSKIDIIVGNQIVRSLEADANGEFADVLDDPLGAGTSALRLRATSPSGEVIDSDKEVTVFIEEPGSAPLVVAQDADGPTEILQEAAPALAAIQPDQQAPEAAPVATTDPAEPAEPVAPKGENTAPVLIRTVDIRPPETSGGPNEVVVVGTSEAGALIRVYVLGAAAGDTIASATGDWIVTFEQSMAPGRYVLRADHINPESGAVVARATTRFRRAAIIAENAPQPTQPAQVAQQAEPPVENAGGTDTASAPVLTENSTDMAVERQAAADETASATGLRGAAAPDEEADISVVRGDSLWRISRNAYGRGVHYTVIFEANRSQITDPNLIFPGQVFTIPEFDGEDAG